MSCVINSLNDNQRFEQFHCLYLRISTYTNLIWVAKKPRWNSGIMILYPLNK